MTIAPPMSHPKEHLAYQRAKGFSTTAPDRMIRLRHLPRRRRKTDPVAESAEMTNAKDAQRAFGTWPAYRVSEGELRSMQWRMWECIRQMRFPELEFASDASIALITYLAKKAEGGTFEPRRSSDRGEMQPRMILALALCGIGVAGCATRPPIPRRSAR